MIAKMPTGHKTVPIAALPALARMLLTVAVVAASLALAILIG
jgi:hypothetical protein